MLENPAVESPNFFVGSRRGFAFPRHLSADALPGARHPRVPPSQPAMGLSVKVDSATSIAGKTVALVVAHAGVGDKIGVAEGAAAGSIELDAGPDGKLEGLATVCKYVASLASEPVGKQLAGASLEDEAMISEWLARAAAEYGVEGAVGDENLVELDAHLASRSFVATRGAISLADLAAYGTTHGALCAMAREKRNALVHLTRWCDHVGAVSGGERTFGAVPFPRAEPLDLSPPAEDKKAKERAGAKKDAAAKQDGETASGGEKGAGGAPGGGKPDAEAVAAARAAKKAAKAEKDKAKGKAPAAPTPKKEITVDVLDIKVGTITRVWEHPGADKLWVESIDVGEAKERQVVSGLRAFKTKAQMEGARVLVLCNVKKGPLRDELSEGMVMCASNEDHTVVDFVVPPAGAPNGERVRFAGFEGEPVEVLTPKKKMFEACAPKLRTNDEGVACYDGVPFMTSAGACASALKQAFIK